MRSNERLAPRWTSRSGADPEPKPALIHSRLAFQVKRTQPFSEASARLDNECLHGKTN